MKLANLNEYFLIVEDCAFERTVYVCRHKKTFDLEFFEKIEDNYTKVSGELRNKLEKVYKFDSGDIRFYEYSKKLNKNINTTEHTKEHKMFYGHILNYINDPLLRLKIKERDNTIKFITLSEYEKREGELTNKVSVGGAYDCKTHEIIVYQENLDHYIANANVRIRYHEYLHAVARQNEKISGFERTNKDGTAVVFIALNEYYTEYLTRKKCGSDISYFTYSIVQSIFNETENKYIENYFDGDSTALIMGLIKNYYPNTLNSIVNILLNCDTLLTLSRYINNNLDSADINKEIETLQKLYYNTYEDLIKLKIQRCLHRDIDITIDNLFIKTGEAYWSHLGIDEFKLPYNAIERKIKLEIIKAKKQQKKLRKQNSKNTTITNYLNDEFSL